MRNIDWFVIVILLFTAVPLAAAERYFDSGGVRIRYIEEGRGEPIVLIHGFSRNVEVNWVEPGIFTALARHHRVVALDCRGHGKSDKPTGDDHYGHVMVDDLVRLLNHLEIQSASLIGYSMGGRIALKFGATYPERTRSVVLIGAGNAGRQNEPSLWDKVARSLQAGAGIRPLITKILPDLPEQKIRAINEETLAVNDAAALASVARGYREFNVSDHEIASLRAPILALVGSEDAFRPEVEALHRRMPRLKVEIVEEADHVSVLQRPELLKILDSFLDPE